MVIASLMTGAVQDPEFNRKQGQGREEMLIVRNSQVLNEYMVLGLILVCTGVCWYLTDSSAGPSKSSLVTVSSVRNVKKTEPCQNVSGSNMSFLLCVRNCVAMKSPGPAKSEQDGGGARGRQAESHKNGQTPSHAVPR